MSQLEALRASLPVAAKDVKLNLQMLLEGPTALSEGQRWGVALAVALSTRSETLAAAVLAEARAAVGEAVVEDAKAAAALMAMNNVFYRFRHLVDKPSYASKPARLRMNRLGQPATTKLDFELYSLAVSAVNGCGSCVQSHERVVLEGGLSEDHVHDAIRLASVVASAATALSFVSVEETAAAVLAR